MGEERVGRMVGEAGVLCAGRWLGGVSGRVETRHLRRFRNIFFPFFQGFFALQVVVVKRLVQTKEVRGGWLRFYLIILLRKYSWESYESTISSEAKHRESGAWVVFAFGGDAVVAGDVV